MRYVVLASCVAVVWGVGCTTDADCTGTEWKCGKGMKGEETKECSLPSDEGEGLGSKCACFDPACTPIEVDGSTTKTKVLFIGDMKMTILAESFAARYSNAYVTYPASRAVGMNARWALRCAPTWLANPVFDYIVVQLGRMDSSDATAVSSPLDQYKANYKKLVELLNEKGGKAKVVLLPIVPMYKEAKVRHWTYDRVMDYNAALDEMNHLANLCPILDKDHFGSPKLCGMEKWGGVCRVQDTDQVYPQETALQHDEEGLVTDLSFGFSSREGDMLTLTFINKCLMYAQPFETVASKGQVAVKSSDIPVHLSYQSNRHVIWVRRRVRVRVRVRVRRRVRVRVRRYVRVRRRVRVRYYW